MMPESTNRAPMMPGSPCLSDNCTLDRCKKKTKLRHFPTSFPSRLKFCTRREIFSKSYEIKPKSDCIYHAPIDSEPDGIPFGLKLIVMWQIQSDSGWFNMNNKSISLRVNSPNKTLLIVFIDL